MLSNIFSDDQKRQLQNKIRRYTMSIDDAKKKGNKPHLTNYLKAITLIELAQLSEEKEPLWREAHQCFCGAIEGLPHPKYFADRALFYLDLNQNYKNLAELYKADTVKQCNVSLVDLAKEDLKKVNEVDITQFEALVQYNITHKSKIIEEKLKTLEPEQSLQFKM
jgi:hypothetical protein